MNKFRLIAKRMSELPPKRVGNHLMFGWKEQLAVTGESCDLMVEAIASGRMTINEANKNVVWWREGAATTAEMALLDHMTAHLCALRAFKVIKAARTRFIHGGRLMS